MLGSPKVWIGSTRVGTEKVILPAPAAEAGAAGGWAADARAGLREPPSEVTTARTPIATTTIARNLRTDRLRSTLMHTYGRIPRPYTPNTPPTEILSPVERNVLGGPLEVCSTDPLTGFYRDGCCHTGAADLGSHTICA